MIKMIRERAGLVNYTNHSGIRTCAKVLSQNGDYGSVRSGSAGL